jgi:hypothetical protein
VYNDILRGGRYIAVAIVKAPMDYIGALSGVGPGRRWCR